MERGNKVGSPKAPKPDHLYETTSPAKIAPILSSIAAVGITPYPAAHKFRCRGKGSKRAASTSVPEFARLFAGGSRIRTRGPAEDALAFCQGNSDQYPNGLK